MELRLKAEIFYIELWHILFLALSIVLLTSIYKRSSKSHLLYAFMFLQLTNIGWMVSKILKTVSYNIDMRWFFILTQYFFICLLEVAFINFAYVYAKRKVLNKKIILLCLIFAMLQFSLILTNPLHFKFYSVYTFIGDDFGPLFYVHFALQYASIIFGICLCAGRFKKDFVHHSRVSVLILSMAILSPIVFNMLYVTGVVKDVLYAIFDLNIVFDITPIAFSVSLFLFYYIIEKYAFLDIMPILESELMHHLDTGYVVLNDEHQVITFNTFMVHLMPLKHGCHFIEFLKTINLDLSKVIFLNEIQEVVIEKKVYEVKKIHYKKGLFSGICLTFIDVTCYVESRNALESQAEALATANHQLLDHIEALTEASKLEAISQVSGNLHDHLGHSMTLAIKLLETVLITYEKTKIIHYDRVQKSISLMRNSAKQFMEYRIEAPILSLKEELLLLKKETALSDVEVVSFVSEFDCPHEIKIPIIRVCKESITNSIKHGHASRIVVTIKSSGDYLTLHIMDNGHSKKPFKEGNGLSIMQENIKKLQGNIRFVQDFDDGFQVFVTLPYQSSWAKKIM